jgi:hypothetical protein
MPNGEWTIRKRVKKRQGKSRNLMAAERIVMVFSACSNGFEADPIGGKT